MALNDILSQPAVFPALRVGSKKQALQELAARASEILKRDEREIFETLNQRERLGSTGVGHGIAIPHGKLPKMDTLFGMFARLEKPVDFEALDGEPVDLVFLLLAPEAAGADHLKALRGYASGTPEGMASWISHCGQAVGLGFEHRGRKLPERCNVHLARACAEPGVYA